jgi:hypothetical protein
MESARNNINSSNPITQRTSNIEHPTSNGEGAKEKNLGSGRWDIILFATGQGPRPTKLGIKLPTKVGMKSPT